MLQLAWTDRACSGLLCMIEKRLHSIALYSAIALAMVAGCSGKVTNDFCAGGAANSTGGASSSVCNVGTGGSPYYCPELQAKYSRCEHDRSPG